MRRRGPSRRARRRAPTAPASPARDLVASYCVTCHNDRAKAGGFSLEAADPVQVGRSAEAWEKVVVKLRSRSMPPPGIRRPGNAAYDAVASWLEQELDRAAGARPDPGRPADLHRLNRGEYANAIRDLLAVEVDPAVLLPPDTQAHGFDTNADALSMEPALLDRYLTAAAKIARIAVGDPSVPPAVERYTAVKGNSNEQTWLWQTDRLGEDFPLGSRGGIAARHYFPVDGEYDLRMRLARTYADVIRGLQVPSDLEIRVDGVRVGRFTIGGPAFTAESQDADEPLHVRVPLKAGLRQVVATIVKAEGVKAEGLGPDRIPIWNRDSDVPTFPLFISSLLIAGPYNGRVPEDSPSRRRIFSCRPESPRDETACATTILSTLARRAYRRPATAADTQTLLGFFERARADGSFDDGIRAALERLLVSPDFLFRIEADPRPVAPGRGLPSLGRRAGVAPVVLPLEQHPRRRAAGRWPSAARCGSPACSTSRCRRMLADPRARAALVNNFFGQWLQTRNVWLLTPDANTKFPWFDDNLRAAFVRETELFLDDQLKADRSIVDLLSADYTFLNEQLAGHYGIRGVYGSHFRRVPLADENRWGLLGKASVLAVTSYPTRTSPTIRGKWLLDNILAAPVPPPPPDVNTNLEERQGRHARLGARDARTASRQPDLRQLPFAHGSARLQPGELRRARAVADRGRRVADQRDGRAARRHQGRWAGGAPAGAGGAEGAVRADRHGQAPDLRCGPRDGILRRSGHPRHRARRRGRRLPLVGDDSGDRQEHAVSDEEVAVMRWRS